MKPFFAAVLALHGLVHLMGPAKAFKLAELPQLTLPVSPSMGLIWLGAAALFAGTAAAIFAWPRWWWAIGASAIVISQLVIVTSWEDAKFGTALNLVAFAGVAFGFLTQGPISLRAQYDADVERGLARLGPVQTVTEADLAHLPAPVQRYLRVSGVVGSPRVQNFRARMHGRIRSGPNSPWMPFTAEQYNFYDQPARLFYMNASKMLVPFQGLHRYVGSDATMRVKAAALVPVLDAAGAEMTVAETVTMFNDMCVLAPATLIDPAIKWEPVASRAVRAVFSNAGRTIRAELVFSEAGNLVNFWSDDRRQVSADGKTSGPVRWSTPLSGFRHFGPVRLRASGEARWHEPAVDYTYIQIELDDVQYNVRGH